MYEAVSVLRKSNHAAVTTIEGVMVKLDKLKNGMLTVRHFLLVESLQFEIKILGMVEKYILLMYPIKFYI